MILIIHICESSQSYLLKEPHPVLVPSCSHTTQKKIKSENEVFGSIAHHNKQHSYLNPNSNSVLLGPAISLILAALVATNEGKFTRFSSVVSRSWLMAKGPSILIRGSLGKHICNY